MENIVGGVIDVMKESTMIGSFKEDVEKLISDVTNGLAIPPEQKKQVTNDVRQDVKETGTSSINSKFVHCKNYGLVACFKHYRNILPVIHCENYLIVSLLKHQLNVLLCVVNNI